MNPHPPVPTHADVDGGEQRGRARLLFGGGLLVLLGATAYVGTAVTRQCPYDLVFLADNGWRVASGLRTHADFSSAWGPVTFLLTALGFQVSGGSLEAIGYAGVACAAVVGVWAYLLLAHRVGGTTAAVLALALALLCCAPVPLGWAFRHTGHAMNYNRWGYAFTFLVLAECLPSTRAGDRRSLGAGASTGAALAVLAFLKVSFFLGALGLVVLSLAWREGRGWRRGAGLAAGFLLAAWPLLHAIGYDLRAMGSDLTMAFLARQGRLRVTSILGLATDHAAYAMVLLGVGVVVLTGTGRGGGRASLAERRPGMVPAALFLAAVYGLDVLLRSTNAQVGRLPLAEMTGLYLGLQLARQGRLQRSVRTGALALCGVGLAAWPVTNDALAVGMAVHLERVAVPTEAGPVVAVARPRLAAAVFDDRLLGPEDGCNTGAFLTTYLLDGLRLLEAHARPGELVGTFDAYNPFPYALGVAPPRGGMSAAAVDYTFSERRKLPPEAFFGTADLVLRPKAAACSPEYFVGLEAHYGDALRERYEPVAASEGWELLRRRGSPR